MQLKGQEHEIFSPPNEHKQKERRPQSMTRKSIEIRFDGEVMNFIILYPDDKFYVVRMQYKETRFS